GNMIGSAEEKARIEAEIQRRLRQREQNKVLPQTVGWQETKSHPTGPDGTTGKTIAAAVELSTGRTWVGHSGISNHKQAAVAAMTALLTGCLQVEDWPNASCAEVDVMKQAMTDGADYEEELWFHAYTWDEQKNRWVGKTWCRNCAQWAKKINT